MSIIQSVHERLDYFCRELRDDGVTKAPQSSHSIGNPINQQTNAGFNAPRFAVGSPSPLHTVRPRRALVGTFGQKLPSLPSRVVGVGHVAASRAWIGRWLLPPPFVFVVRPPSPSEAFGVGHVERGPFTVSRKPSITSILRLKSVDPASL